MAASSHIMSVRLHVRSLSLATLVDNNLLPVSHLWQSSLAIILLIMLINVTILELFLLYLLLSEII